MWVRIEGPRNAQDRPLKLRIIEFLSDHFSQQRTWNILVHHHNHTKLLQWRCQTRPCRPFTCPHRPFNSRPPCVGVPRQALHSRQSRGTKECLLPIFPCLNESDEKIRRRGLESIILGLLEESWRSESGTVEKLLTRSLKCSNPKHPLSVFGG